MIAHYLMPIAQPCTIVNQVVLMIAVSAKSVDPLPAPLVSFRHLHHSCQLVTCAIRVYDVTWIHFDDVVMLWLRRSTGMRGESAGAVCHDHVLLLGAVRWHRF